VAALLRRVLSILTLSLLVLAGTGVSAATYAAAPTSSTPQAAAAAAPDKPKPCKGSHKRCYPPKKPTSSVPATEVRGVKSTRYCVDNYEPNSTVTITNDDTDSKTTKTDSNGHACVVIKLHAGCNTIVAHGFDQAGDPATSSATVCVLGEKQTRGGLAFTGSNLIVPAAALGAGLAVAGIALTVSSRRRRRRTV
jgi:hypothetical protein